MMTRDKVIEMLASIVDAVDYDVYKEIFIEGYAPPEEQEAIVNRLVDLVAKYVDII